MNQKEYDLLAQHINHNRMLFKGETSRKTFAKQLAYELDITYTSFDIDKFLTACGIEPDNATI